MRTKPRKPIELQPIKESLNDYEAIEQKIVRLLRSEIYIPLLKELTRPKNVLTNSIEDVLGALRLGRIVYSDGMFLGKFSGAISRELKRMGAIWDLTQNGWKLSESELTPDLRIAIETGNSRFEKKVYQVSQRLLEMNPDAISEKLVTAPNFQRALTKVNSEFKKSVRKITLTPQLSEETRLRIASEWQLNMRIWVKKFTRSEIEDLRKKIQLSTFAGNRYESMTKMISDSYGMAQRKAKFLARQETNLLMAKYKENRYQEVGINEYKWQCVGGTAAHPVRPLHKELDRRSREGETFFFSHPPIDSPDGKRHNPGENYGCRCVARPVVWFK